jgi:hypothetical protein
MRRYSALPPTSDWPDDMYVDEDGSVLTDVFSIVLSVLLIAFTDGFGQVLGAVALFLSVALIMSQPKVMDAIVRRYWGHA